LTSASTWALGRPVSAMRSAVVASPLRRLKTSTSLSRTLASSYSYTFFVMALIFPPVSDTRPRYRKAEPCSTDRRPTLRRELQRPFVELGVLGGRAIPGETSLHRPRAHGRDVLAPVVPRPDRPTYGVVDRPGRQVVEHEARAAPRLLVVVLD